MYLNSENNTCFAKKPSTWFNLDSLIIKDDHEIKKTANIYQYLSQPQKDLIRHQAPGAYSAILALINATKDSQETAFKTQADLSKSAMDSLGNSHLHNHSFTRDERADMYHANDRIHSRSTEAVIFQNLNNNSATVAIVGLITVGAILISLFG